MDRLGHSTSTQRVRGRAKLFELVGVVLALAEREELDERDRRRLDRAIGARHHATELRGLGLLRLWLQDAPTSTLQVRIKAIRSSLAGLNWLLITGGLFFGWATTSALLSIKLHDDRINVVLVVTLLVIVPFGLLVAGLLGWLWSLRGFAASPTRSLTEILRSMGLGRLVLRMLSPSVRQDVEVVIGRFTAHGRLYSRVERGQLLLWSQTMGLAFAAGALVATLAFVVFTDLAFGWSTTLDISASDVHRWVHRLAAPWAAIWPDANPSLDLVETTRFFRVAPNDLERGVDPLVYGGWWPFLVMSIASYAVLPRLFILAAVSFWVSRETGKAIGLTPGIDRLLDRLKTPILEAQALAEEGEVGSSEGGLVATVELAAWARANAGAASLVVRWAELLDATTLRSTLEMQDVRVFDAGGRCLLEDDASVVQKMLETEAGVLFCVRGYEPPVLDVLDFLRSVRDAIGPERSLLVLLFEASEADVRTWRRKLIGLGDPRLVVSTAEVAND